MRATRHPIVILAGLTLAGVSLAQEEPAPPRGERDLPDPSIFRIEPPSSAIDVAGIYTYTSPFDGKERRIEIRESGEFWKYLGAPVGGGDAALKLDPATEPGGYLGETGPALDPCLGERTQVDHAFVFPKRITMVLLVPYVPAAERPLRTDCDEGAVVYRVIPRGGGKTQVRLTPTEEVLNERDTFRGAGAPGEPLSQAGDDVDYPRVPRAEARFNLNAPKVAAGTPVRVDRVGTDGRGRIWYHVVTEPERGREPAEGVVDGPAEGWVRPEQVVGRLPYTLHRE